MKTQETYYRNVVAAAKLLTRMEVDNETDEYQLFQDLTEIRGLIDARLTAIREARGHHKA